MPGQDSSPERLSRALIPAILVGVGAFVGIVVAYRALPVLQIVAVAALLAVVLRTIASGLERIGASPLVSALLLLAALGSFGALLYLVVLPNIAHEVRVLTSDGPGSLDDLAGSIRDVPFAPDLDELI